MQCPVCLSTSPGPVCATCGYTMSKAASSGQPQAGSGPAQPGPADAPGSNSAANLAGPPPGQSAPPPAPPPPYPEAATPGGPPPATPPYGDQTDTEALYTEQSVEPGSAGGQGTQHGPSYPGAPPGNGVPPEGEWRRRRWVLPAILTGAAILVVGLGLLIYTVVVPRVVPAGAPAPTPTVTVPPPSSASPTPSPTVTPSESSGVSTVLVDETFATGGVPQGWSQVDGAWKVVDGRLQGSATGDPRSRIELVPVAPENYRVDLLVRFIKVENPRRWIGIGLDHHFSADWGAVLVARSATTDPDGMRLAQKTRKGKEYIGDPEIAAESALGVGQDHWIGVEVRGKRVLATIDGSPVLTADNLKRTEGGIVLIVHRDTVQVDNLKITRLGD